MNKLSRITSIVLNKMPAEILLKPYWLITINQFDNSTLSSLIVTLYIVPLSEDDGGNRCRTPERERTS